GDFTSHRRGFGAVLQYVGTYYGFKSFQIFDRLCESVILLAGMLTVAWMRRNTELLPLLSAGVSTRRAVAPALLCAFGMMGRAAANQEFALPNIDVFMIENRQNPAGAKATDCKGAYATNHIHISGENAINQHALSKTSSAGLPRQISRGDVA